MEDTGGCENNCTILEDGRTTMTGTFSLYCGNRFLRSITISVLYAGNAVGSIIIG